MTTLTTPDRNGVIFAEVPPAVELAIVDLLTANAQCKRAIAIGIGPRQTYAEMQQAVDAKFRAWRHAEAVIEEAQGGQRLNGFYPVEGRLVGFAKRSKRGFELHNYAAAWAIHHPKASKGAKR